MKFRGNSPTPQAQLTCPSLNSKWLTQKDFKSAQTYKFDVRNRNAWVGELWSHENYVIIAFFNSLSANPTKWQNTLKQFVGKLPTNCLSVFGHFVNLTLKGLKILLFTDGWSSQFYWHHKKCNLDDSNKLQGFKRILKSIKMQLLSAFPDII